MKKVELCQATYTHISPHRNADKNVYNNVDNVDKYMKLAQIRRSSGGINCL